MRVQQVNTTKNNTFKACFIKASPGDNVNYDHLKKLVKMLTSDDDVETLIASQRRSKMILVKLLGEEEYQKYIELLHSRKIKNTNNYWDIGDIFYSSDDIDRVTHAGPKDCFSQACKILKEAVEISPEKLSKTFETLYDLRKDFNL